MTNIAFCDLSQQHAEITTEIEAALSNVLGHSWFVLGKELDAFESEFAEYCDVKDCVGVGSGTDAISLALSACGIGPGDEVITVAHTFVGTAMAISQTGATPVFVDIDENTFTIDSEKAEAAITQRTRAIVPVHLYGQCSNMDALLDIRNRHGLYIVEDAAQAHGAQYRSQPAGSMGDVGCFSFYPTKNLGALGDAGAIVTSNPDLATRCRQLRNYGKQDKYHHHVLGVNSRLDELQAAVLRIKLRYLDHWNARRRAIAARYDKLLAKVPQLVIPHEADGCRHIYHIYPVLVTERDRVQQHLYQQGVESGVHYPVPIHLQHCYQHLGYKLGDLPSTEHVAQSEISLPMFPGLSEEQTKKVASALQEAL